jgi:hypothetical protein
MSQQKRDVNLDIQSAGPGPRSNENRGGTVRSLSKCGWITPFVSVVALGARLVLSPRGDNMRILLAAMSMGILFATGAHADDVAAEIGTSTADQDVVQNIWYLNKGDYISKVSLAWKNPGDTSKKTRGLGEASANQYIQGIPYVGYPGVEEGAEIWFEYQIILGDQQSCRKSKPVIYKNSGPPDEDVVMNLYKSTGKSLTNNRCRLTRRSVLFKCTGPENPHNIDKCGSESYQVITRTTITAP